MDKWFKKSGELIECSVFVELHNFCCCCSVYEKINSDENVGTKLQRMEMFDRIKLCDLSYDKI